jgi:hypothetical protein
MTAKNLYAYTLQPVTYEITEAEQRDAQLKIWRSTNKISMKAWIIMAVVTALSILGLILLKIIQPSFVGSQSPASWFTF